MTASPQTIPEQRLPLPAPAPKQTRLYVLDGLRLVAAVMVLFGYFALMAVIALGGLDFVRWRGLVTAGALTYPLYLLHQVIELKAIHVLHTHVPVYPLFAGMLLLAYLVHAMVERPAGRWLSKEITRSYEAMRRPEPN